MDLQAKLSLLGDGARFEECDAPGFERSTEAVRRALPCITHLMVPGGRPVRALKVLLSNFCANDCAYCALRAGRDAARTAFTPDELARAFDQMHRAGLVQGLFLSSTVGFNPLREMDRILATAEILRERMEFAGYLHLKILPGATSDQIRRAAELADRISINLEAPDPEHLRRLSQRKDFQAQLLPALKMAGSLTHASDPRIRARSVTTQIIAGAGDESDRTLLFTAERLYRHLHLARVYYSAFHPIPDTPLQDRPAAPSSRQHRLYQTDFLLRQYGFRTEELVFSPAGNLPAETDPKLVWAEAHPEFYPVEINRAPRAVLLRVPGIGPRSAERIITGRRRGPLTDVSHLRAMGVNISRAAPFILLCGRAPARQLELWSAP